jgi:hypothetical protein
LFPIDDTSSAVTHFQVVIDGDNTILAKVEEKTKAFDTYDDAIASGRSASLLQKHTTNTRDMFKISLGNLPPAPDEVEGGQVTVTIMYLFKHVYDYIGDLSDTKEPKKPFLSKLTLYDM